MANVNAKAAAQHDLELPVMNSYPSDAFRCYQVTHANKPLFLLFCITQQQETHHELSLTKFRVFYSYLLTAILCFIFPAKVKGRHPRSTSTVNAG